MGVILNKPYKFGSRVIVEGKKGTVISSNDTGIVVQFVIGKAEIKWSELKDNPGLVSYV